MLVAGGLAFASSSCSSSGFGDAALGGLCVAGEADCLQECREGYKGHGDRWVYQSCVSKCQPGGSGCG
jgi:hypothetical protein